MNKLSTKSIGIAFGLVVIVAAFSIVFGPSLHNLKTENVIGTVVSDVGAGTGITTTSQINIEHESDDEDENESDDMSSTQTSLGNPVPPVVSTTPSFTLAQVATHNSATTCWSAINMVVYDLTGWVNSHPGGKAAILMICGKDGSPLFNMQHGGQNKPAQILAQFKIGILI